MYIYIYINAQKRTLPSVHPDFWSTASLWCRLAHLPCKCSGATRCATCVFSLMWSRLVSRHVKAELISVNRSCDPCDGLIWVSFRVPVHTRCVYTHHVNTLPSTRFSRQATTDKTTSFSLLLGSVFWLFHFTAIEVLDFNCITNYATGLFYKFLCKSGVHDCLKGCVNKTLTQFLLLYINIHSCIFLLKMY